MTNVEVVMDLVRLTSDITRHMSDIIDASIRFQLVDLTFALMRQIWVVYGTETNVNLKETLFQCHTHLSGMVRIALLHAMNQPQDRTM